jgi:hypothetical protein
MASSLKIGMLNFCPLLDHRGLGLLPLFLALSSRQSETLGSMAQCHTEEDKHLTKEGKWLD